MSSVLNAPGLDACQTAALLFGLVGEAPEAVWGKRFSDGTLLDFLRGPAVTARGCERPVRLAGGSVTMNARTGAVVEVFDTADLVDGVLYKPCGSRLESVCPSCAHTYRYDTYQLIASGLRGGKGVPESVLEHPALFVTFTAPGFGPVHTSNLDRSTGLVRPCRARRDHPVCTHGQRLWCTHRHDADDRRIGTPLCLDCYDHDHQVVWNRFVPQLWARTMDRLHRAIAALARTHGVSMKLRYAKVAEFQARGAVHLHALFRLDGHDPHDPDTLVPPPAGITPAMLVELVRTAAADTALRTPPHPDSADGWVIAWGEQLDARIVREGLGGSVLTEQHVAGYLAKYATKSTESMGTAVPQLTEAILDIYADPATHLGRMLAAAWRLGRPEAGDDYARLRAKAHMLGFSGHFSTKSRRYSTTLGALRAARRPSTREGVRIISPDDFDRGALDDFDDDETVLVVNGRWSYVGSEWRTTADGELARQAAALARSRDAV